MTLGTSFISTPEINDILVAIDKRVPLYFVHPRDNYAWTLEAAARGIAKVIKGCVESFTDGFTVQGPGFKVWTEFDDKGELILKVWLGLDRDPRMAHLGQVAVKDADASARWASVQWEKN